LHGNNLGALKIKKHEASYAMKKSNSIIRNITPDDVTSIQEFVKTCKPLGIHSAFTYWVLSKYFHNLCFIIEEENQICAILTAIRSAIDPDHLFIWQIGVSPIYRRKHYSQFLLQKLLKVAREIEIKSIQFSVAPDNIPSYEMFRKFGKTNNLSMKRIDELSFKDLLTDEIEFENVYEYRFLM